MGFFEKIFRRNQSKDTAKKRLQIVLMHDRSDISPEMMDNIRRDILGVISRYMDVDDGNIDIDLSKDQEVVALEVSVPVLRMKRGTAASLRRGEDSAEVV
ncbi:MAG: cell division topological specificity factor MinE [Pyramidobacter sp.]|nr:cell division topological specificity factor MinE [Pyramidobacter sp.]